MVLQGESKTFSGKPGCTHSGFLHQEERMKVLLIIVVFNFETGSELETRMDFNDEASCHAAALERFQAVDSNVAIHAMEIREGQEILEGTMIAYGEAGGEIGMYACNTLRASASESLE